MKKQNSKDTNFKYSFKDCITGTGDYSNKITSGALTADCINAKMDEGGVNDEKINQSI